MGSILPTPFGLNPLKKTGGRLVVTAFAAGEFSFGWNEVSPEGLGEDRLGHFLGALGSDPDFGRLECCSIQPTNRCLGEVPGANPLGSNFYEYPAGVVVNDLAVARFGEIISRKLSPVVPTAPSRACNR
jgi:hypothetical protein